VVEAMMTYQAPARQGIQGTFQGKAVRSIPVSPEGLEGMNNSPIVARWFSGKAGTRCKICGADISAPPQPQQGPSLQRMVQRARPACSM